MCCFAWICGNHLILVFVPVWAIGVGIGVPVTLPIWPIVFNNFLPRSFDRPATRSLEHSFADYSLLVAIIDWLCSFVVWPVRLGTGFAWFRAQEFKKQAGGRLVRQVAVLRLPCVMPRWKGHLS